MKRYRKVRKQGDQSINISYHHLTHHVSLLQKRKPHSLNPSTFPPNFVFSSFFSDHLNAIENTPTRLPLLIRAAFIWGTAYTAVNSTIYNVDGGQRAVLLDRFRGVIDTTAGEGTHFRIPWMQKPFIFDIRTRPHTFSSISGTKDLQMVTKLPYIFQHLGLEYDEKLLPSIGNEVLKAVVAQFNADQLLTERPQVSALVRETLIKRARDFNIVLDDVAITHLSYGAEFSRAVEQKQVAQQEAERSKFIVIKADQERRAAIVRAEGESEAAQMISTATSEAGMGLIDLRRIEAAREIASTLAKTTNVSCLPGGNNMLLALDPNR